MSDTKHNVENTGRRKVIKKIAVGVGAIATYNVLPTQWTRPIVDQIVMPAHAATSGTSLHDPCSLTLISGDQTTATVGIQVNGYVTPPTAGLATGIVATTSGGVSVTTTATTLADGTFSSGTITLTGGPGITAVSVVTTVTGADGSANCSIPVPTAPVSTTPASTTSAPTTSATGED